MAYMTDEKREIHRKLKILEYAEQVGDESKACRYFGIGRASFYHWRKTLVEQGEAGLVSKRSAPHNHPNYTANIVRNQRFNQLQKMSDFGEFGSVESDAPGGSNGRRKRHL